MRRAAVLLIVAACGPAAAPAPASPAGAPKRACVHEATEPVPASCIRASARGKLLKEDKDAGVRIWQACEGASIVDGFYVAEHVGNGRKTADELAAIPRDRWKEIHNMGADQAGYGWCGGAPGAAGDDGCVMVGYKARDEDVPAAVAELAHTFGGADDVCVPFLIETGIGEATLLDEQRTR